MCISTGMICFNYLSVVLCCVVWACRRIQQSGGSRNKKLHNGRCPISEELDNKVLESVELAQKRLMGHLNDQDVLKIAKEVGRDLGIMDFKASGSWLRRWKCRCEAAKRKVSTTGITEKKLVNGTPMIGHRLTSLSEDMDRFVTLSGVGCGHTNGGESNSMSNKVMELQGECVIDYSTPEHNYCIQVTSPASLDNDVKCHSPDLKSNVAELLENVALLQAHDHLQAHERTSLVGLEGGNLMCTYVANPCEDSYSTNTVSESTNGGSQEGVSCFLDYSGLDSSTDFSCSTSPASLLEEEPFISVLNHRSFTDPFPFLPPSYICFPPDNLRPFTSDGIGIDDLLQEAQELDSASKRVRDKKSKSVRPAQTGDSSSSMLSSSSNFTGSIQLSGSQLYPYQDHKSPPPHHASLSLLTSPTYPSGLSSSPPGGLLANRMSQPVFPDEPEIVFHELQLGSLHTTPSQ